MKTKKLLTVFTVLMLAGSLAACGRSNEKHRETGSARQGNISSEPSQKVETNQSEGTEQRNILIAYFSRFGNTGYPNCTHDGYGAGSSYETVEKASHAGKCLDGIAVEAEDVTFTMAE